MFPNKSIQNLNLRRELQRRLEFLKHRIPESIIEHHFAQGKITTLPKGAPMPPQWALNASRHAWTLGLGRIFNRISTERIKKDPRGVVRELRDTVENLAAYTQNLSGDIEAIEKLDREFVELRALYGLPIFKKYIKHLNKLDDRIGELMPPPTQQELLAYSMRSVEINRNLIPDDDGFFSPTLSGKIYHAVWFFWPELLKDKKFSSKSVHKWLGDSIGIFASEKLVESIYTKIGAGAQGRAT